MIQATPDPLFGNRGTLWTGVPYLWRDPSPPSIFSNPDETHFIGGTSMGIHLLSTGSLCTFVWNYDFRVPWEPGFNNNQPSVRLVIYAPDGKPGDGNWNYAHVVTVSEQGFSATPLATCTSSDGKPVLLLRSFDPNPPAPGVAQVFYELCTYDAVGLGTLTKIRITTPLINYGILTPLTEAESYLLAPDGTAIAIATTYRTKIRLIRNMGQVTDIDLSTDTILSGLENLRLSGIRFETGSVIFAMTAYVDDPFIGSTTLGAVLKIRNNGTRDSTFANNGLWVSPINTLHRNFISAGESGGILAGYVGKRAVLFGIDRNSTAGNTMDLNFGGGNGYVELDLGASLNHPVMVADNQAIYLFAQRVPTIADASGDLLTVGCRFNISNTRFGFVDQGFGNAGILNVWSDGHPLEPSGILLSGSRLYIGGTRQHIGSDCDRIPMVTAYNTLNGDPEPEFGFGGLSLHASMSDPVYIAPDGTSVFSERTRTEDIPVLRFILPSGIPGLRVPLTPIPKGALIRSITKLSDGSYIISGSKTTFGAGMPAWVMKLTSSLVIDTSFGTAGVLTPGNNPDHIFILGIRSDGKIVLQINNLSTGQLAIINPGGQLDVNFGTNGFITLKTQVAVTFSGNSVTCFLDEDDAVICVVHSSHTSGSNLPWVRAGLFRITPAGIYDTTYGLEKWMGTPADNNLTVTLISAGNLEYSGISPRGIWRAGGKLYLIATGFVGGGFNLNVNRERPIYPGLIAIRWNSDGSRDNSFGASGMQEEGFDPDFVYLSASGVLKYSTDTAIIYGMAGSIEEEQHSVGGGSSYTVRIPREPKPALFKFDHPAGFDMKFGKNGAVRYPIWEILPSTISGAVLNNNRIRIGFTDLLLHRTTFKPQNNFAGLIQWELSDTIITGKLLPVWLWWVIGIIILVVIIIIMLF